MFPLIVLLSIQVWGIQLGAELTVPPCPADPTLATTICVKDDKSRLKTVVFPSNNMPAMVANRGAVGVRRRREGRRSRVSNLWA